MDKGRINTIQGACIVAVTKHIMQQNGIDRENAYKTALKTELYKLLMDEDTGLFLEPNAYLNECYDIEMKQGIDALYSHINA